MALWAALDYGAYDEKKGIFTYRRRQQASLSSQAWKTKMLFRFLIYLSGQSSSLASILLTWRQWRGAEFDARQGLTKTLSTEKKPDITRRERRHPTARRARCLQTSKAQTPLRSSVRLKACLQAMTLFLLTGGTMVPTTEMLCY